ncbi:dienelactone hydrolase [Penicillium hispanicum]|uniref:dienelactone hydrolase n=1 Tax=Penicillium hispanicum TaxID=1080232 RepID=UPI002542512E|nr:dienelactone hydrolase [Penicillium hispanicum]KAJ5580225.1 dienelactone hydrolase [Penicillium hispanicum]
MASLPPSSCCYKGVKHEGVAKGKMSQLGDFEVYTVQPDNGSTEKGILILTDIIGHKSINVQLIADQFAANGYFVMIPDLFDGDPVPLNKPGSFDMQSWRAGGYHPKGTAHLPANVDPIVTASLAEMRKSYGCKKIGAVGYCFGAKYVARHLDPDQKIDAGFNAHPSHVSEDELRAIKGPLAIAAAETDAIFPAEKRHQSEVILRETGLPYQINLYSGVSHGFAVRGDPNNRVVMYAKETAFLQALQWFGEHLRV